MGRVSLDADCIQGLMPETVRGGVVGGIRDLDGTRGAKRVWVVRDVVQLLHVGTWRVERL